MYPNFSWMRGMWDKFNSTMWEKDPRYHWSNTSHVKSTVQQFCERCPDLWLKCFTNVKNKKKSYRNSQTQPPRSSRTSCLANVSLELRGQYKEKCIKPACFVKTGATSDCLQSSLQKNHPFGPWRFPTIHSAWTDRISAEAQQNSLHSRAELGCSHRTSSASCQGRQEEGRLLNWNVQQSNNRLYPPKKKRLLNLLYQKRGWFFSRKLKREKDFPSRNGCHDDNFTTASQYFSKFNVVDLSPHKHPAVTWALGTCDSRARKRLPGLHFTFI